MNSEALIFPGSFSEFFYQIYGSGRLSLEHRNYLKATILQDCLTEEEQRALDRVIYAVRRGWLKLTD